MSKRGDLSARQIVLIVLAVAGFAVILIFLGVLRGSLQSEEEACRLSVLTRATTPEVAQGYIPLKCQTQKICLTDGSGSGECATEFAGEEIVKIKLDKKPEIAADQVEEVYAKEMFDCWNIMGEGQLSLFTEGVMQYFSLGSPKGVSCVVCSRIAIEHEKVNDVLGLDENGNLIVDEKTGVIGKDGKGVNVHKYLQENQVPGSALTYLQKFTDEQFQSYNSVVEPGAVASHTAGSQTFGGKRNEMSIVFSQIRTVSSKNVIDRLLGAGGVLAGGSFMVGGVSTVLQIGRAAFGSGVGALITVAVVGGITTISMSNAYAGRNVAAGYCGKVTTTLEDAEAREGCSAVSVLPYDVKTINKMCKGIEGRP